MSPYVQSFIEKVQKILDRESAFLEFNPSNLCPLLFRIFRPNIGTVCRLQYLRYARTFDFCTFAEVAGLCRAVVFFVVV
jgi:hypothetical protein